MAILTAQQLKAREFPEFEVQIGNGDQVLARVPDIQLMVLQGIMPTPLLGEVVKMIGEWAGTPIADLTEDVISSSEKLLFFVNLMVTNALVRPRAVLTEAELDGDETVLVTDLTVATRKAILLAVTTRMASPEVVAAVEEFPGEPAGAGTRQDVPPVPAAAV